MYYDIFLEKSAAGQGYFHCKTLVMIIIIMMIYIDIYIDISIYMYIYIKTQIKVLCPTVP